MTAAAATGFCKGPYTCSVSPPERRRASFWNDPTGHFRFSHRKGRRRRSQMQRPPLSCQCHRKPGGSSAFCTVTEKARSCICFSGSTEANSSETHPKGCRYGTLIFFVRRRPPQRHVVTELRRDHETPSRTRQIRPCAIGGRMCPFIVSRFLT